MASKSPTGLMNIGMWEGSKEDVSQDKKLAKKKGMTMKEWESSAADKKHDTQKSAKGLRGGGMATRGMGVALAEGGMACKAGGGMVTAKGQGMARSKSTSVC
jgi:hypothetical protein